MGRRCRVWHQVAAGSLANCSPSRRVRRWGRRAPAGAFCLAGGPRLNSGRRSRGLGRAPVVPRIQTSGFRGSSADIEIAAQVIHPLKIAVLTLEMTVASIHPSSFVYTAAQTVFNWTCRRRLAVAF